jgi:hypothetical protein
VLERFGDPRALARKLWWDALKGRIMRNRLVTLAAVVAMVVSLAAVGGVYGLAWSLAASNERMAAQTAELVAGQQAFQREMLERLGELANAPPSPTASKSGRVLSDWRPFSIRVVSEGTRKPIRATCMLWPNKSPHTVPAKLVVQTDTNGVADFGTLPPGIATLVVHSEAYGGWQWSNAEFWLRPEGPEVIEVLYPETSLETGRLRFSGLERLEAADTREGMPRRRPLWCVTLVSKPVTVGSRSWLRAKEPGDFTHGDTSHYSKWIRSVLLELPGEVHASDTQQHVTRGMFFLGQTGYQPRTIRFEESARFVPPIAADMGVPLAEGQYAFLGVESVDENPPGSGYMRSSSRLVYSEPVEFTITAGKTSELNLADKLEANKFEYPMRTDTP